MMAIITSLVTIFKGIGQLQKIGEFFVTEWIKYDVDRLGGEAEAKKEEYAIVNAKLKASTTDSERRALLRTANRLR